MKLSKAADFAAEHAEPYRQRADRVLGAAATYNGSEDRYQELMGSLIALEQWMVATFGNGSDVRRLPDEVERAITARYSPDSSERTISDFMDMARDRFSQLMQDHGSPAEVIHDLPILTVQLEGTLLPPGEEPRPERGNGEGSMPPEYAQRLKLLIQFLLQHDIFTDDLVVVSGINTDSMMRQETYALVEIPRIGKEVLVCNQVGEATFISEKMLGRDVYMKTTKDELLGYPGIHRIIFRTQEQWEAELAAVLFGDREGVGRKINVRDREELRTAILAKYTPERWVAQTRNEIRDFQINGIKVYSIGTLFGVEQAHGRFSFLLLGEQIFGRTCQVIQEHLPQLRERRDAKELEEATAAEKLAELGDDPVKWSAEIRTLYTSELWIKISAKQRRDLVIHSKRIVAIARIFGITGSPNQNNLNHLELGARIWGEDDPHIGPLLREERANAADLEELGNDLGKWVEQLRQKTTLDTWINGSQEQLLAIKIHGTGINRIGVVFGAAHQHTFNDKIERLKIALKVWTEEAERIQSLLRSLEQKRIESEQLELAGQQELGNDPQKWAEAIRARTTLDEWLKSHFCFNLYGKGYMAIGRIFGLVAGRKVNRAAFRVQVAMKIWGERDPAVMAQLEQRLAAIRAKESKPHESPDE